MLRRLGHGLVVAAVAAAVSASPGSPATRVLGGTAISVQSAPWTVYVEYRTGSSWDYSCTGSILDASLVLTAAHCLYDDEGSGALARPDQMIVDAGFSNFSTPTSTDLPQVRNVSAIRVHPGYVPATGKGDDVAVLTLASPLDLSGPTVRAVSLPAAGAPYPAGASVEIAGFGQDVAGTPGSGPLHSMTATVEAQGQCGDGPGAGPIEDNAIVLCASSPTSDVCPGDSGGGLVTTGSAPVPVLVGVVDRGDCTPGGAVVAAYLGAPELLRFIQGDDAPPIAPRPSATTALRLGWGVDPPEVDEPMTCSTSGWAEPVQVTYSFLNAADGQVLQTGARASYVIAPAAVGASIACEAAVTGAGGTTLMETEASPKVAPAPRLTIERVAPLAGRRGRPVTVHVILRLPPAPAARVVKVCATPPPAVAARRCASSRESSGDPRTFGFAVPLGIRATARPGRTRIVLRATAGREHVQRSVLLRIS